jgi:DNA-binding transcriptional regulator YhcF (GntR family)/predicted kinase
VTSTTVCYWFAKKSLNWEYVRGDLVGPEIYSAPDPGKFLMPTDHKLDHSEPLPDQIVRYIRTAVVARTLRDGQVLPSTRDLAKTWGVSVWTINEAMKVLAADGIVVSKSRSMRIVRNPDQPGRVDMGESRPHVLLIGGYAGTGKTELGRIVARRAGWPILDKDTMTRPVVELALETMGLSPHDRESDTYMDLVRPREYESLMASAQENVDCAVSTILTAPFVREFNSEAWIARMSARFASIGADITLVWVRCDSPTMLTYLRHRGAARDAAKLAAWPAYLQGIDPAFAPAGPHIIAHNSANSEPLQSQAERILQSLVRR